MIRRRRALVAQGAIAAGTAKVVQRCGAPKLGAAVARQRLPDEIAGRVAGPGKECIEWNAHEHALVEAALAKLRGRQVEEL